MAETSLISSSTSLHNYVDTTSYQKELRFPSLLAVFQIEARTCPKVKWKVRLSTSFPVLSALTAKVSSYRTPNF